MRVDAFDFDLPPERIALHPVEPRDAARMLVVKADDMLRDAVVTDLLDILAPGDALVVNDTRVLPAALSGVRYRAEGQARVSLNLHKRIDRRRWAALGRPGKRLAVGDRLELGQWAVDQLRAVVVEKREGGDLVIEFDLEGPDLDEAIKSNGAMPLPPYIGSKRPVESRDRLDYQTVYAARDGAVAAPTAGLHFTAALLERLQTRGIFLERVTLHVGAGTFLPVKVDDTADHVMHAEWGTIDEATAARLLAAKAAGGRIVAVGTTSLRLLESAARSTGRLAAFSGDTDIFITPGFEFRAVDVLMTNFHLPRSTLFMLVSAFAGLETMRAAYAHAIADDYRFYSYGDASLLFRQPFSGEGRSP